MGKYHSWSEGRRKGENVGIAFLGVFTGRNGKGR